MSRRFEWQLTCHVPMFLSPCFCGGDRERIELDAVEPSVLPLACDDMLGLDEALRKLEQEHPHKAEMVKLRF